MKSIKAAAAMAAVAVCALFVHAETPEQIGTRLSKENDDRPTFERVKSEVTLKIYGSNGAIKFEKKMMMAAYTSNIGTEKQCEMYLTTFLSPSDDMGNAYMAFNHKTAEDEKYVYLKGIRKEKKVSGADKKLSFFGSDFANGDVSKPDFLEWNYKYLSDQKMDFKGKSFDCYVVEQTPKTPKIRSDYGYSKRILYFEKKTRMTLKMEFFDESGIKVKELRLKNFTTGNNVRNHKVYYETGIEMRNMKTGSYTELMINNPKFEDQSNLRTDIFTVQYLTRKWW
jgi:hypothetical protein